MKSKLVKTKKSDNDRKFLQKYLIAEPKMKVMIEWNILDYSPLSEHHAHTFDEVDLQEDLEEALLSFEQLDKQKFEEYITITKFIQANDISFLNTITSQSLKRKSGKS